MKKVLIATAMFASLTLVGCSKEASDDAIQNAASEANGHINNATQRVEDAATSAQAEMVAAAKQAAITAQVAADKSEAAAREVAVSSATAVENTANDIKQDVKQ